MSPVLLECSSSSSNVLAYFVSPPLKSLSPNLIGGVQPRWLQLMFSLVCISFVFRSGWWVPNISMPSIYSSPLLKFMYLPVWPVVPRSMSPIRLSSHVVFEKKNPNFVGGLRYSRFSSHLLLQNLNLFPDQVRLAPPNFPSHVPHLPPSLAIYLQPDLVGCVGF